MTANIGSEWRNEQRPNGALSFGFV